MSVLWIKHSFDFTHYWCWTGSAVNLKFVLDTFVLYHISCISVTVLKLAFHSTERLSTHGIYTSQHSKRSKKHGQIRQLWVTWRFLICLAHYFHSHIFSLHHYFDVSKSKTFPCPDKSISPSGDCVFVNIIKIITSIHFT